MVYDEVGNRTVYIDPVGNRTTFVFDALNREIEQIDPLGKSATFAYSAIGQMTSTTDRLGRRRDFTFDDAGRQIGEVWINADTSTANVMTFTYDAVGNQLTAGDNNGWYTFTYDAVNRVKTVANPTGQSMTFVYNAVGMRTDIIDSFGGSITSGYDELNRLRLQLFTDGTTEMRLAIDFNERGLVEGIRRHNDWAMSDPVARTSFIYDDAAYDGWKTAEQTWFVGNSGPQFRPSQRDSAPTDCRPAKDSKTSQMAQALYLAYLCARAVRLDDFFNEHREVFKRIKDNCEGFPKSSGRR